MAIYIHPTLLFSLGNKISKGIILGDEDGKNISLLYSFETVDDKLFQKLEILGEIYGYLKIVGFYSVNEDNELQDEKIMRDSAFEEESIKLLQDVIDKKKEMEHCGLIEKVDLNQIIFIKKNKEKLNVLNSNGQILDWEIRSGDAEEAVLGGIVAATPKQSYLDKKIKKNENLDDVSNLMDVAAALLHRNTCLLEEICSKR
ncbi:hypothetical protein DAMA08_048990 [Martiniozyma asiatica (nom. inval.)]|nr:hypothetical protein DAMA08_048990 [Martiniozyma asiatica]